MRYFLQAGFLTCLVCMTFACSNEEQDRIKALNEMPVLWESTVLVPDPDNPGLKVLIPLSDRYDPNLVEFMTDTAPKTEDFIPGEVQAFANPEFDSKPREVTLRLGDRVSVLKTGRNKSSVPLFLVRTLHGTYAWLYAYHIEDKNGRRMAQLK